LTTDDKVLAAARRVLADAHQTLSLQFAFRLWDGSSVPAGAPTDGLAIAIRDPAVLAEILRRPSLESVLKAHVAGLLEIENGTFFDLAKARPVGKVGRLLKRLDKGALLGFAGRFLFSPGIQAAGPRAGDTSATARDGRPETNRRNVAFHYDVSNAFYRLFLDEEMVYTCAYFQPDWHDDIDRAQRDKLDMICRKLRLKPGDRLLDIGCGWGALICHAAEHYGVIATGVTLAAEQRAEVDRRVAARGLTDRVSVLFQDYATIEGENVYDKISSIGMFEQVGLKNHETYFKTVHRLLKPRGLYLHHSIARPAKPGGLSKAKAEYKALVKYIFPGGELDHVGLSIANLEAARFEVHDVEAWREHYQRTTRLWHDRLWARRAEAEAEVGPETTRTWLLYLAGCSLAFERGAVGIFQTVASKRAKGASGLASTRAELYR
jgi:cyclopropane-fatty-acyl-phospholipid synthase